MENVTSGDGDETGAQAHRAYAVEANNSTWELIDLPVRSPDEDEDMLRRAYAAAYHWERAAGRGPENDARADWLLAKVHLLVGRPEVALYHARRCRETCDEHGLGDFDLAYAHEATARALKALGQDDEAAKEWAAAKAVPVVDDEDRAILEADLAEGP